MTPGASQRQTARSVLALNVGSASYKAASYELSASTVPGQPIETGRISIETDHEASATSDEKANTFLLDVAKRLPQLRDTPEIVTHRIVHGGDRPDPVELTPATLAALADLSVLAPLHQPPALALVRAAIQRWPDALQIGVFDTSWHHSMPEKYRIFPIPYALYANGVKRYGFHGLAFQSVMRQLAYGVPSLTRDRVVLAHLGGGSSLCAVLNGRCVNTTMGMTPLGGIPMTTRSGSMDPGVLLHLQRGLGMSAHEIDQMLWRDSGLKGLSGESGDMRQLLASNSAGARRAIDVYVAGVVQGIAAMAACLNGINVLAFSGGIGTHAAEIRARVTAELEWLGLSIDARLNQAGALDISHAAARVKQFVVAVDEEAEMVDAIALLPF